MEAKFTWKIDPTNALPKLAAGVRNKALRIAINAGASPVKAAMISQAPVERGYLKRAIIIKVKNYKSRNCWVAIIGAGSKFKRVVRPKRKGKGFKPRVVRPARYQHLVDRGTKRQRGRHFVGEAFRQARSQFEANVMRKLHEQITQLMAK